jgi:ABC-type nitrate/sulfonate/bicarbonate transport system ATPase subunit
MIIKNLSKSYKNNQVYKDFNLEIKPNKITCILGESGSGKTTLLNIIAGLTSYDGEVEKVNCSYIFQTPRLVPNLTVLNNLKLIEKDEQKIYSVLKAAEIDDKANFYPKSISGGQAQRVALCRAFLYGGDIILMDEPFSSLDLKLKIRIMDLFLSMRGENGQTALFVTHDIDEAVYLSDRIIILQKGKIIFDCVNLDKGCRFGESTRTRATLVNQILK